MTRARARRSMASSPTRRPVRSHRRERRNARAVSAAGGGERVGSRKGAVMGGLSLARPGTARIAVAAREAAKFCPGATRLAGCLDAVATTGLLPSFTRRRVATDPNSTEREVAPAAEARGEGLIHEGS